MNQLVVHTKRGQLIKGSTSNFLPGKDRFHLIPAGGSLSARPLEILIADLKAVFFVKDLKGQPERVKKNVFDPGGSVQGKRIRVVFSDGETMLGTTQTYQPGRSGFFVVPMDPGSNNERCFIVSAATREITLL
jgi:hypothetical protein